MTTANSARAITWPHGVASVSALGGMIGPAVFLLPDGRQVSPFHMAPWWNEPEALEMGGLIAGLRGEWPCVPFGYPLPMAGYPPAWQAVMDDGESVADVHGFGSNNDWQFEPSSEDRHITMSIAYPADHDIERLVRVVRPDRAAAAIDFELQIFARRDCALPLALHGCFRLPLMTGSAVLEPGAFGQGWTHPGTVEPGASLFAPDSRFSDLGQVPARDGQTTDAARLPFAGKIEELLQLNDVDGTFGLRNEAEGYRMRLTWDAGKLPSVLLWYSNFGRDAAPWRSRHLCIGIEPTCSAFGLSVATSTADNPIAAAGTPTSVTLSAGTPLTIAYRVAVEPL